MKLWRDKILRVERSRTHPERVLVWLQCRNPCCGQACRDHPPDNPDTLTLCDSCRARYVKAPLAS